MIMPQNRMDRRTANSRLLPVYQISRDWVSMPNDFITDTTTVAMMPAAKPTLYRE